MADSNRFEGLPDIIQSIIQSPEMADILQSIRPSEQREQETPAKGGDFNIPPDLMDKLPQVIAALKGAGIAPEKKSSSEAQLDINDITSKLPRAMEMLAGSDKGKSQDSKNRKALLSALKPYMNDQKRAAIDTMLSVESMTEIMMLLMGGEK